MSAAAAFLASEPVARVAGFEARSRSIFGRAFGALAFAFHPARVEVLGWCSAVGYALAVPSAALAAGLYASALEEAKKQRK